MSGWFAQTLSQLPTVPDGEAGDPDWYPLQHYFGLTTFGINIFVARRANDVLVGEHDEEASGQQELYLVLEGEAEFVLDGELLRAPEKTAIAVTESRVRRSARALAPGTVLLVAGAAESQFSSTWNDSHFVDVPRASAEQRDEIE
jgi:hypothetical protein